MCENESKMWNGIFSFEFSFSRKSNLKIFRTRVNLIQCPYEWIIDKGLCYVKKKSRKKYFHFQSSVRNRIFEFENCSIFFAISILF